MNSRLSINFADPKTMLKLRNNQVDELQPKPAVIDDSAPSTAEIPKPPGDGNNCSASTTDEPQAETATEAVEPLETDEAAPVATHPLNGSWTLWYIEYDATKTWADMLHKVDTFDTVERFWSLINHLKKPSEIKMSSDYCLFKKDIPPMWEDTANKHGGRWIINFHRSNKTELDNSWLTILLCLIGESCEHCGDLCGVMASIRPKCNKISIWTANASNVEAIMEIGKTLCENLTLSSDQQLCYQLHKDAKQTDSKNCSITVYASKR